MNKKGETEIIFFAFGLLLFIGYCFASVNPQTTFMRDCKDVYADDFYYETECLNNSGQVMFNNSEEIYVECEKIDKDALKKYCLDKFASGRKHDG